jgi:hypothetical protein
MYFEYLSVYYGLVKFLFRNKTFSFELLRAAGYANYAGADLGEVLATVR